MTRLLRRVCVTAGCLLTATLVPAVENKAEPIKTLSWMAGCWESANSEPRIDEQWMSPGGGMMLGMARTVKAGRATQFEQMRILEEEGILVFTSKPSGQEEASFTAIEVTPSRVVFENKSHDFPQRIIYRRNDDGTLAARIEGEREGKVTGFDFPMRPATCGGHR